MFSFSCMHLGFSLLFIIFILGSSFWYVWMYFNVSSVEKSLTNIISRFNKSWFCIERIQREIEFLLLYTGITADTLGFSRDIWLNLVLSWINWFLRHLSMKFDAFLYEVSLLSYSTSTYFSSSFFLSFFSSFLISVFSIFLLSVCFC